jgi:hypothetical protein
MPQVHTVRQGECISSIACKYGFFPDALWNLPDNAALKQKRRDGYLLVPGDELVIPDKKEKQEPCVTDKKHRFRRKGVPETLRLVVKDEEGDLLKNVPYILTIDGEHRRGNTNADGKIKEPILPSASEAKLLVGNIEYKLQLGGLDPVSEDTGVQGRLRNMGYDCGPVDGDMGKRTKKAIEQFQRDQELEPTGEVDDATRQRLEEIHDQGS